MFFWGRFCLPTGCPVSCQVLWLIYKRISWMLNAKDGPRSLELRKLILPGRSLEDWNRRGTICRFVFLLDCLKHEKTQNKVLKVCNKINKKIYTYIYIRKDHQNCSNTSPSTSEAVLQCCLVVSLRMCLWTEWFYVGDLVAETVSKVFVLDVDAFCDVVASSFDPSKRGNIEIYEDFMFFQFVLLVASCSILYKL